MGHTSEVIERLKAGVEARQREIDHISTCDQCWDEKCDEALRLGAEETRLRHIALGMACCVLNGTWTRKAGEFGDPDCVDIMY